jgi:hypothetical protein
LTVGLQALMSRYLRRWRGMMMTAGDDHAATKSIEKADQENEELCTLQNFAAFSAAPSIP